jgi:hypothetical protein
MSKENIPFQVSHIIDSMLNTKENIYVRGNYRTRLDNIRAEIDKAISKYDQDLVSINMRKKKA